MRFRRITVTGSYFAPMRLRRVIDALRSARWITRERVMFCGALFALVSVSFLALAVVSHTRNGLVAENGEQLGVDFINYFIGAKAVASGNAARVYDRQWLRAVEEAVTGPGAVRMYSYPPIAMLLSLPLALFSFVWALIAWTVAGAGLCFGVLKRLVGWQAAALAVIGAPAAFFNIYGGQNAYFTAALLAGGLIVLDRRPVIAGSCFGCLAYKPHMAIMLPLALAASGHWRAFFAAGVTAVALVLASVAVLGSDTWLAFIGQISAERGFLDIEAHLSHRMPTVFVALRELGASLAVAYGAQAVSAALAVAAVVVAWRSPAPLGLNAAILVVATFLATPHAWDYDEILLVFAAAWLWREAQQSGFLPWERIAIVVLLVLPMPSIVLNVQTGLEPGPVVLWLVLLLLLRRALGLPRVDTELGLASGWRVG